MSTKYKPALVTIAAVIAVIGLLGLLDVKNLPYAGYFSGPGNDVVRIFPGSPAETAGLEVGDVVKSIGGIAVTDTRASSRRARAEIGGTPGTWKLTAAAKGGRITDVLDDLVLVFELRVRSS